MWINKIKERKFDEAIDLIGSFKEQDFSKLQEYAFIEEDLVYYDFLKFLIAKYSESSQLHYWASELLCTSLNLFSDSYINAYQHTKIAIENAPNDISLLEHSLLFYQLPDKIMSKTEANIVAKKILSIDPSNKAANLVIQSL